MQDELNYQVTFLQQSISNVLVPGKTPHREAPVYKPPDEVLPASSRNSFTGNASIAPGLPQSSSNKLRKSSDPGKSLWLSLSAKVKIQM